MVSPAYNEGLPRPAKGGRPRTYKTLGLVLRAYAMRDADRLVTVLTPSLGKLKLAVRGARRPTSKIGGHLDVLNQAQLEIAAGHAFDVVTGAESVETFPAVKSDLGRLAEAVYLMEFADQMLPVAAPHPAAHQLLSAALRLLETGRDPGAVARYSELAMLTDAGYLPEFHRCVNCGRLIEPERHRFAPALGGVVCDACAVPGRVIHLSVGALKVLRHFAGRSIEEATNVSLGSAVLHELEAVLGASVRHVLERELHSAGFIEHLHRLRAVGPSPG